MEDKWVHLLRVDVIEELSELLKLLAKSVQRLTRSFNKAQLLLQFISRHGLLLFDFTEHLLLLRVDLPQENVELFDHRCAGLLPSILRALLTGLADAYAHVEKLSADVYLA